MKAWKKNILDCHSSLSSIIFMKSCIGFILDLSDKALMHLQNIKISISGNQIKNYFPFISFLSNCIDDQFDIFIGSYGLKNGYNNICDILLLFERLLLNSFLPNIQNLDTESNQYKTIFCKKFKDAGAVKFSELIESTFDNTKCLYLLSAFQNDPLTYDEIGYIEQKKVDKLSSFKFSNISDTYISKKSGIKYLFDMLIKSKHYLLTESIFMKLKNDPYQCLVRKFLFSILEFLQFDTNTKLFLPYWPKKIIDIISNICVRLPPECKQSIIDIIQEIFFDTIQRMDLALIASYKTFKTKTYLNKYLMIISNGTFTGSTKDPLQIINDNKNQACIICCYLGPKKIDNPKQLFYNYPSDFDDGGKKLFQMSSVISICYPVSSYLARRGWKIPSSGFCRLFAYVNDENMIYEFISIMKDVINNNDIFINIRGALYYNNYVNENINNFKTTDQKGEGICWSHACATVIHMTIARIYGRKLPSFLEIRDELLQTFGRKGQNPENVLNQILYSKYKLHYRKVDENEAKNAVKKLRPCVASFGLTALQWYNFSRFFKRNRTGVLTSEIINEPVESTYKSTDGRHSVVLIGVCDKYLTFLNSWGNDFGDNGKFRIADSSVLGPINYYDIYWLLKDLSQEEIDAFNNNSKMDLTEFIGKVNKSPETKIKCPNCNSISKAKNYYGDCKNSFCPICHLSFTPTVELLSKIIIEET